MRVLVRRRLLPPITASYVCRSCRVRQYSSSSAPPEPPAAGLARLSSRRLISVAGPDAAKYLQGVITSSIVAPDGRPRRQGFYTGFLNAQGRVLHDVFVYPDTLVSGGGAEPDQSFLVEVDAGEAERLEKHIKRYKLRARFAARLLHDDEAAVWHAWDDSGNPADPDPETDLLRLLDPRSPGLGSRYVVAGDATPRLGLAAAPVVPETAYQIRRYLHGVAEGQDEIQREQALPLESNMDVMGGVDCHKGCYVVQELTILTKHRVVVRKRRRPCILYSEGTPVPERLAYRQPPVSEDDEAGETVPTAQTIPAGASISRVGMRGRSAGKWLRGVGNIGLALCRVETMTDVVLPGETAAAAYNPENQFVVAGGEDGSDLSVRIKAFVPAWLRLRLAEQSS